ncbi:MAG: glycosyltransferase, partial [Gammaproteobacteria bacterium]|nr:glycosyltransferase [Gammaproteobacteria bacterium]
GEPILFTSFTATGYQAIKSNFSSAVEPGIIPVDFFVFCRRFVNQHRIKLCLLMETELWPELLYQTAKNGVPIVQVNARLSDKSVQAPIYVRYLLRRCLANIGLFLTRNEQDRDNLIGLGADSEQIKIIGNLKSHSGNTENLPGLVERDYLLLASSHEDEELQFIKQRPTDRQDKLIVIAPRHPTRSRSIQKQLTDLDINFAVRSDEQVITDRTEVYLADTLGELKAFMAHAEIVIMGGSFNQTGGHNLIEPANLGCTIITGPSDSNIRQDIDALSDGIIQVADMQDCWQQIEYLLANPEYARELADKARIQVQQSDNMPERYLAEIRPYL